MKSGVSHKTMDRRALLRGSITIAGAAIVLPGFTVLSGCSATPPSLASKMDVLAAAADRIIPATDTPGALVAKVPDYIASVFENHLTEDQQREFSANLDLFDAQAALRGHDTFASAPAEEQDAVLRQMADADSDSDENAIFQQIKELTVFGFYTSEAARQELAYEEIPGRYAGCVPLSDIGSAWLERGV